MHGKPEFNLIKIKDGEWQLIWSVQSPGRFISTQTDRLPDLPTAFYVISAIQRQWEILQ